MIPSTLHSRRRRSREAMSLLELLAALAIMSVIAIAIIPRIADSAQNANESSCHLNKGIVEVQIALWQRENGTFPRHDLSDIGSDPRFFPDGIPTCPVDGTNYTIDPPTGRVNGHQH